MSTTRTGSIVEESAICYLAQRGMNNLQIRSVLPDTPYHVIAAATTQYWRDGVIALYRDECLARVKNDPHPYECMEYLFVRGIPQGDIEETIGMSSRKHRDPELKGRYQACQLEIVRAAVAAGREL